jgi:hypothetical protein
LAVSRSSARQASRCAASASSPIDVDVVRSKSGRERRRINCYRTQEGNTSPQRDDGVHRGGRSRSGCDCRGPDSIRHATRPRTEEAWLVGVAERATSGAPHRGIARHGHTFHPPPVTDGGIASSPTITSPQTD